MSQSSPAGDPDRQTSAGKTSANRASANRVGAEVSGLVTLASWRPMHVLVVLLLVAPFASPQLRMGRMPGVRGTVEVSTTGASGAVAGGRYHITLPVRVANSTESAIVDATFRVRAYACAQGAKLGPSLNQCRKLVDTGRVVLMQVASGDTGRVQATLDGAVPAGTPNGALRILCVLQGIRDAGDRKREAEDRLPVPSLPASTLSPENDLQARVDRSIMPA